MWRWQHRRGRTTTRRKRKASPRAPKVHHMARRRYGRKRRGHGRRSFLGKFGGLTGIATSAFAANQLGAFDAANQAMTGDFVGAANTLGARATSPSAIITAILPIAVVGITKKGLRSFGVRLPSWL